MRKGMSCIPKRKAQKCSFWLLIKALQQYLGVLKT
jgi:hypothetical protein